MIPVIRKEIFRLPVLNRILRVQAEFEDGFLTSIELALADDPDVIRSSSLARDLGTILEGKGNMLSIPLKINGTAFQKKVWDAVRCISFGELMSYSDIALYIGCGSSRAVGQALRSNPLPILIPCHRVVGKTGELTGFSCGLEIKSLLIQLEKNIIYNRSPSSTHGVHLKKQE